MTANHAFLVFPPLPLCPPIPTPPPPPPQSYFPIPSVLLWLPSFLSNFYRKKKKEKKNKTQKPAATLTSPGRLKPSCTYSCVPTPVFVSSPGSVAHLCSSPHPPCPLPARLSSRIQGGNEGRKLMPVPNRKTADTVRVCTYVCGCSKLQA